VYIDRYLGSYPTIAKFVRYSAASVVAVVVGQTILLTCFVVIGLSAVVSNITAVTLGTIPNYLINRAWTFKRSGTHSVTREVIPFWSMAILGLILSTISVAWVDRTYDGNPLLVSAANFAAFGVLWVARFVILDRILFAPLAQTTEEV
jgi:putative flippase GtrA